VERRGGDPAGTHHVARGGDRRANAVARGRAVQGLTRGRHEVSERAGGDPWLARDLAGESSQLGVVKHGALSIFGELLGDGRVHGVAPVVSAPLVEAATSVAVAARAAIGRTR
jgi:hypothetical protein